MPGWLRALKWRPGRRLRSRVCCPALGDPGVLHFASPDGALPARQGRAGEVHGLGGRDPVTELPFCARRPGVSLCVTPSPSDRARPRVGPAAAWGAGGAGPSPPRTEGPRQRCLCPDPCCPLRCPRDLKEDGDEF